MGFKRHDLPRSFEIKIELSPTAITPLVLPKWSIHRSPFIPEIFPLSCRFSLVELSTNSPKSQSIDLPFRSPRMTVPSDPMMISLSPVGRLFARKSKVTRFDCGDSAGNCFNNFGDSFSQFQPLSLLTRIVMSDPIKIHKPSL